MSDKAAINVTKPEEVAYWSRLLNVTPRQLMHAVKATGSNLVSRMIYYLKAEGILPQTFELESGFG
jgi:hypothetical protein